MFDVSGCPHAQDMSFPTEVSEKSGYSPSATQVVRQANQNH